MQTAAEVVLYLTTVYLYQFFKLSSIFIRSLQVTFFYTLSPLFMYMERNKKQGKSATCDCADIFEQTSTIGTDEIRSH